VLVICGSDIVTLGIARSLGPLGIPVHVLSWHARPLCRHSRYVHFERLPNPLESERGFFEWLLAYGRKTSEVYGRRLFLMPTNDAVLVFIAEYFETLKQYFVMQGDPTERTGLTQFIRKDIFFRRIKYLDIPAPFTLSCSQEDQINRVLQEATYPCVVKPSVKDLSFSFYKYAGGAKVIYCQDQDSLRSLLQDTITRGYSVVIQEQIPGNDTTDIYTLDAYANREGKLVAGYTSYKLRQISPQQPTCTVMVSKWVPTLFEYGRRLLGELGFWGICNLEFKRDSRDASFKLLEVNFRPWYSISKVAAGGVNIPLLAYRDVYEGLPDDGEITPPASSDGLRWVELWADLYAIRNSERTFRGRLRELMRLVTGKNTFGVLSVRDPLPFLILTKAHLMGILRRIIVNLVQVFRQRTRTQE
jgi:D-aspartate ligase